jgi:hypothetical protein
MTNYVAAASVLEELMLLLLEKGADVPKQVAEELRSGRSYAGMSKQVGGDCELETKTLIAFQNVEMNLLSQAEITFGREIADSWQIKLNQAKESAPVAAKPSLRYITGVPKGSYQIRVQTEYLETADNLEEMLAGYKLKTIPQEDDFVMIYGEKENVMNFLKEIRQITIETLNRDS